MRDGQFKSYGAAFAALLILDLVTKQLAFADAPELIYGSAIVGIEGDRIDFGIFAIQPKLNWVGSLGTPLLSRPQTVGALALGFVAGMACAIHRGWWQLSARWLLGVTLLLAGAAGNGVDRLLIGGVRDFAILLPHVPLPFGWAWPNGLNSIFPFHFNLADVWLLAGFLWVTKAALSASDPR